MDWTKVLPIEELCPICLQPDSCGDCDHTPLSQEDIIRLTSSGDLYPVIKLTNN